MVELRTRRRDVEADPDDAGRHVEHIVACDRELGSGRQRQGGAVHLQHGRSGRVSLEPRDAAIEAEAHVVARVDVDGVEHRALSVVFEAERRAPAHGEVLRGGA